MSVYDRFYHHLKRAIQFIETELNEDRSPSLNEVAAASGISPFHFHRVFKLMTGETCAQAIRRLRLAKGTVVLLDPETSITEAAMAAGYASSQAFAKVIKRELSAPASDIRSEPERLAQTLERLSLPDASSSDASVVIEICKLEPLQVLMTRTTDKYPDLVITYGDLFEAAHGPENVVAALGIPHRDIETWQDEGFIFDAAAMPFDGTGLDKQVIEGGYAIAIRHKGLDKDMPHTLNKAYSLVLASESMSFADAPCLYHYIDDPEIVEEAQCRTDIYIPIMPTQA